MGFSAIEMIVGAPADPQDIPRSRGIEALSRYIADEPHDVYLLQCLKINDNHLELIVRQMRRRVQVVEAGDANYIVGEPVERSELLDENDRVNAAGKIPATYENVLLGITTASLSTDSFISAASFQEPIRKTPNDRFWTELERHFQVFFSFIVQQCTGVGTFPSIAVHATYDDKKPIDYIQSISDIACFFVDWW